MERRRSLLLVCLLLTASPWASAGTAASIAEGRGGGEVLVYLQPLPSAAGRVAFSIASAAAIGNSGAELPLELALTTVTPSETGRQRRLASGRLPAGAYAGLSIRVQKASVRRDKDEAALLVPDTPIRVDVSFTVPDGRGLVLWLSLVDAEPVVSGSTFSPVFSASIAPRPMLSRAGFVSATRSNWVTVFDRRLRQVVAVVPTCAAPAGMALDQRAGRLYVACQRDDEIQVIDVTSAEVVERTRLTPGDEPREIALTPDGRTLLSVNAASNSVTVLDAVPLTRLERISVGSGPASVVIDPTGARAFVLNAIASSLSVIDIGRRSLVTTVSTDAAPIRGAFNARGDRFFVVHERSPYVTVFDAQQLTVVTRTRVRIGIGAIKVDSRRGLVYIGGRRDRSVEFYDPSTLLPIGSMKTRGGVSHLAIDAEDNSLYMVSPDTGTLAIGSLAERRLVSEIDVGDGPYWVAVMGER